MQECEKIQNLIFEYIDGSISKANEARLTDHLEKCDHCQKELEFAKNMMHSLQEIPSAPLPEQFNRELRKKLEGVALPVKKSWMKHLPKYSFAVSAVAAFAIMIIAYHGHLSPQIEQQPGETGLLMSTASPDAQQLQPDVINNVHDSSVSQDKTQAANPKPSAAPKKNSTAIVQTAKPKLPETSFSANQKVSSPVQDQVSVAGKSSSGSSGGGNSSQTARQESGSGTQRKPQGIMFVVHSTVSQRTLDLLYSLPSFQAVDANYYRIPRSYQNKLIELLKDCEYSIHFASEASRVDESAIIIELI